jgi:hypothetical protein
MKFLQVREPDSKNAAAGVGSSLPLLSNKEHSVSEHDHLIEALIQALTERKKEQKQNASALPVPYQSADSLPGPNHSGFLARIFDPGAAAKSEFERAQLQLMIDTRLKAMGYEAHGYAETIRLDQQHRVRRHEQELVEQDDVQGRYAKARAEIQKHIMQQNLVAEIADLHLDAVDEQFLIAKIVRIFMSTNDKESPNGHK